MQALVAALRRAGTPWGIVTNGNSQPARQGPAAGPGGESRLLHRVRRDRPRETGAGDIPRGVAANRADRKQARAVRGRQPGGRHRGRAGSGHVHRLGAARQGVADCPTAAGPSGGPRRRTRADVGLGAVGCAPTGYADLPACRRYDNRPLPNRLRASTLSPTARPPRRRSPAQPQRASDTKCYKMLQRKIFPPFVNPSNLRVSALYPSGPFLPVLVQTRHSHAPTREPIGTTPSQSVRPELVEACPEPVEGGATNGLGGGL